MPAPNPNISAVRPSSLFIVSAANPTLTRSKKAMTKHRIRNGMRRHAALRDARRAAMSIALPSLNCKRRADSLPLDPSRLDDGPPLLDVGLLQGAERFRGLLVARKELLPEIGEPLSHRRIGQCP